MAPADSLARLRKALIDRAERGETPVTQLCREAGMSRSRFYELRDRYHRYGEAGAEDAWRSARPCVPADTASVHTRRLASPAVRLDQRATPMRMRPAELEVSMRPTNRRSARWATLLASLSLAFAFAGGAHAQSEDSAMPAMSVDVTGLEPGSIVTENEIAFTVEPVGYELSAAHAGTPPAEGIGHYHVVLDGGLIDMFADPEGSISLQNVSPGPHTLMVVPAMNDHMPVREGAAAIEFDYQPAEPLPEITSSQSTGEPTVTIESPAPGETVSGDFEMTISTTGFELSEALLGKPNVDGVGHWHVFVDAVEGMGTMMGMAGTDTFTVSTDALAPGQHTFFAVLVDNLHAPFDPPIATAVELDVAAADGTAAASGETATISLTEFALDPSELALEAGTFTFEGLNDGSVPHGLVLEGEGVRGATPDTAYAPGSGQSFTVDLTPGTYEIYCPVPGHRDAGMSGTVNVSA